MTIHGADNSRSRKSRPCFAVCAPHSEVEGARAPNIALADREASTGLKIDPAILLGIIADQARSLEAAQATIRRLLALVAEAE